MIATLENVELVMWEKTMMPESVMSKDEKGKTVFTKTGVKNEYTKYIFRDLVGDKLVFVSKVNDYRNLERKRVDLEIDLSHDDFSGRNKIALKSISPSK